MPIATSGVFQAEPNPPKEGVMQVREDKIVGRDIVGYGINGEAQYFDDITYPFPSIRFMKNTPEIMVNRFAPLVWLRLNGITSGQGIKYR